MVGACWKEGLESLIALPPPLPPVRLDRRLQLRWLAQVLLGALVRVEVARVLRSQGERRRRYRLRKMEALLRDKLVMVVQGMSNCHLDDLLPLLLVDHFD